MRAPSRPLARAAVAALSTALCWCAAAPEVAGDARSSTATARWRALPPSLLSRQEVVAGRIGNRIYVAGGFEGNKPSSAVERYDIDRRRWSMAAPMPVSLNHHAAVVHRGMLYVVDGFMGDRRSFEQSNGLAVGMLLRYDPVRRSWTKLAPPPTKRGAVAAGVIGDRLYVAGGFSPDGGELGSLEIYDFKTGRWSAGPSMALPRDHVAGAVSRGKLYVVGGRTDLLALTGDVATVERFDPVAGRWERAPDLTRARSAASAVTSGDSIVVFGGEESTGTIGVTELFDPRAGRWRRLQGMGTPRAALAGAAFGSRIFAIEGTPTPRFGSSRSVEELDLPDPPRNLAVTVRPRRVVVGRRVRLVVRVTAHADRTTFAASGVTVRIGRRSARTGRRGRADFVTRFQRRGRHLVSARKRGFIRGRAAITVIAQPSWR
jgi:hypothetical protein